MPATKPHVCLVGGEELPSFFTGTICPTHAREWCCGFCNEPIMDLTAVLMKNGRQAHVKCLEAWAATKK